jgi:hypothetical protein
MEIRTVMKVSRKGGRRGALLNPPGSKVYWAHPGIHLLGIIGTNVLLDDVVLGSTPVCTHSKTVWGG